MAGPGLHHAAPLNAYDDTDPAPPGVLARATRARVPNGVRLYAVGDIHGRADLLGYLHARIRLDASDAPEPTKVVVYLGDYVDRGPDSRGVVDLILGDALPGFRTVALRGNHEELMLEFLTKPESARLWVMNGGDTTLRSYGVDPKGGDCYWVRDRFAAALPAAHQGFFAGLPLTHAAGDYFFAHAGIRPGVPLDSQATDDLLWIRDEFLNSAADFGKVVVHGHTPRRVPDLLSNRIGIDTGAFATGRLTCLVLAGAEQHILQT